MPPKKVRGGDGEDGAEDGGSVGEAADGGGSVGDGGDGSLSHASLESEAYDGPPLVTDIVRDKSMLRLEREKAAKHTTMLGATPAQTKLSQAEIKNVKHLSPF